MFYKRTVNTDRCTSKTCSTTSGYHNTRRRMLRRKFRSSSHYCRLSLFSPRDFSARQLVAQSKSSEALSSVQRSSTLAYSTLTLSLVFNCSTTFQPPLRTFGSEPHFSVLYNQAFSMIVTMVPNSIPYGIKNQHPRPLFQSHAHQQKHCI